MTPRPKLFASDYDPVANQFSGHELPVDQVSPVDTAIDPVTPLRLRLDVRRRLGRGRDLNSIDFGRAAAQAIIALLWHAT